MTLKDVPDISIVVSCWNSAEIVEEALDSIVSTAGDIVFDVTVIDDASTDGGVAHIAEKFKNDSRFTFIRNEVNVGIPALNIMLERSRAKYIMMLDTDARLKHGALRALFDFMEHNPKAGSATGRLLNPDGSNQFYYRRIITPWLYFFTTPMGRFFDKYLFGLYFYNKYHYFDGLDLTRDTEMEQPPVACVIIRREALGNDQYILDPQFKLLMVDVDLSKRLYDRGYKVYVVAGAPVTHLKSTSWGTRGKVKIERDFYESLKNYFKKHHRTAYPLMLVVMRLDQLSRMFLRFTVDHEPIR